MRKMRRKVLVGFLSLLIATLVVWEGQAQSQDAYPTKPIEIIVPYAAGGATDLTNRTLASFLSKKWGVPVNVVNKPGGNAIPGILSVYDARPDGYTVLGDANATSSMLGVTVPDLPFKIMDRTFVSVVGTAPVIFVALANSPFKDLKEVAAEAKRNPGNFTWAWTGSGNDTTGFAMRQFFREIGVDFQKTKLVSTKGGGREQMTLVAGGHVILGGTTVGGAISFLKGGTLKGLAVTSMNRNPELPDVPTASELGYPNINTQWWSGISGPPKLPAFITAKWEKALEEMVRDPELIAKMKSVGVTPGFLDSKANLELVIKETDQFSKLWGSIK